MTQSIHESDSHEGHVDHAIPSADKRKRTSRACDRCHREGRKCSPDVQGGTCMRCLDQGVSCTYERPAKRRGPAPRMGETSKVRQTRAQVRAQTRTRTSHKEAQQNNAIGTSVAEQTLNTPALRLSTPTSNIVGGSTSQAPHTQPGNCVHHEANNSRSAEANAQFAEVVPPDILGKLVEIFYHTAYPLRPYFHWPTYRAQVQSQQYRFDWGLHTFTMAVCTMAAGRLCDGVLMPTGPHPLRLQAAGLFSKCYDAAMEAIPRDLASVPDCYYAMKAKAILAAACLQNGEWKRAAAHLGDYASLSAMSGFCKETNWPSRLNLIQKEERRRVFWGVYQQEQYLSSNFNFASRQREVKAMVKYPAEIFDDDDIAETSVQLWSEHVSFIKGFNFCTDLYRVLERIDGTVRPRQQAPSTEPGGKIEAFLSVSYPSKKLAADSLHLVSQLYDDLPQELKKPRTLTGDLRADRYGFIACNVLLTTQTLRMLLVGAGKPNLHLRCAIASELLDELSTIPIDFFHASSTVSLHHLAHLGHMLGDDVQDQLPIWTYLQVRNILTVLADFLDKIESDRMIATGLAGKLRSQINRIDHCMKQGSSNEQEAGLLSMGKSLLPDLHSLSSTYTPGSTGYSDPYPSPQATTGPSLGANMHLQSFLHGTVSTDHQAGVTPQQNATFQTAPTTSSLIDLNHLPNSGTHGLAQDADIFHMPSQPQYDASQNSLSDNMFSGDLFASWPFLST